MSKWKSPGRRTKYDGLYRSWVDMHNRCRLNPHYKNVIVCELWQSYDNFFEDMSPTWFPGACLSRGSAENGYDTGNYEPSNCHWATKEQSNKELNSHLDISGDNSPSKRPEVRAKFSKAKSGSNNPRAHSYIRDDGVIVIDASAYESQHNLPKTTLCHCASPNTAQKYDREGHSWSYYDTNTIK